MAEECNNNSVQSQRGRSSPSGVLLMTSVSRRNPLCLLQLGLGPVRAFTLALSHEASGTFEEGIIQRFLSLSSRARDSFACAGRLLYRHVFAARCSYASDIGAK